MKTKELKKYPVQVLMMTVTYMISMLLPILFSYLIDDILIVGKGDELWRWFGIPKDEALMELLHVDFEEKEIKSNPVNLSYGQQQKLALLRTFGA